ncbi:MAG: trigger factor [Syntrophomonadaceae bacterium]|jgi:trigger factor
MDIKLEKIENSEAYIEIGVDAERFDKGLQQAYRKVVKQVTIPGFRKGKVPRQLLEAYYGKEVLYQDAIESIIPDAFQEAVEKLSLFTMAPPSFEISDVNDEGFTFKATVAVKPEITIGDIEGLPVTIPKIEVTEDEVDRRLEEIRSRYAQLAEKETEPAEKGDILIIDFEGFVNGEPFKGGKGTDYRLEIGSNTFIPGFEDQLIGSRTGENLDVNVTFPQDYQAEDLAGANAVFKVLVKKIETRVLRPLDDELVQEISEFETVEQFRKDAKAKLEEIATRQKQQIIRDEVINQALKVCDIPIADAVVIEQLKRMLNQFEQSLVSQGINLEQYFKLTNTSEEDFNREMWPQAERTVKTNLLLEKLVEEKGIEVTDEEIDKQISDVVKGTQLEFEKAKENLKDIRENIKFGMKIDKVVQYLIECANITETEKELNEESKTDPDE